MNNGGSRRTPSEYRGRLSNEAKHVSSDMKQCFAGTSCDGAARVVLN